LVFDSLWAKAVDHTQDAPSCSVSASTTSVGLAVARKMRQTSATILIAFNTLMG
jgi:hypothetical protein